MIAKRIKETVNATKRITVTFPFKRTSTFGRSDPHETMDMMISKIIFARNVMGAKDGNTSVSAENNKATEISGDKTIVSPIDRTEVLPNRYAESGKIAAFANNPMVMVFKDTQMIRRILFGISRSFVIPLYISPTIGTKIKIPAVATKDNRNERS